MHETAFDRRQTPPSAAPYGAGVDSSPRASAVSAAAPVIVHFPDVSRTRGSNEHRAERRSSVSSEFASAPVAEPALPTYDGVHDVLGSGGAETAGPKIHVPPQTHHDWSGAAPLPRPRRSPSHAERQLFETDFANEIEQRPDSAASWRPVIALAIVLCAAASLTFWIAFGGAEVSPSLPIDSIHWPAEPSEVVSFPNARPTELIAPVDSASPVEDFNQLNIAAGESSKPNATESFAIGPRRADTGRQMSEGYPSTNYPAEWRIERVATAVGPDGAARDAVRSNDPIVSFEGSIETPNLRAQHDNDESSLH